MKYYSIRELSGMAGVSARTLRYYDETDLLAPLFVSEAGYRYYGEKEVLLLQQILFYKERGFNLKEIKKLIYQEDFDILGALMDHLLALEKQREHMDSLIRTVKQTILEMKGEGSMSDAEKFEAFKEKLVQDNEKSYGKEIREKYGNEAADNANQKLLGMSEAEYERFKSLEDEIRNRLEEGVRTGISPDSEEAGEIVRLHRKWLCMTWKQYTKEAHIGVAEMYVCDERFRSYYDRNEEGCARLLASAVRCQA